VRPANDDLEAEPGVALDRAGITVFRAITFLAAGPANERNRSVQRMTLVSDPLKEIDDVPWSRIVHFYGRATEIPNSIRDVATDNLTEGG
jgi:hypothetical protein